MFTSASVQDLLPDRELGEVGDQVRRLAGRESAGNQLAMRDKGSLRKGMTHGNHLNLDGRAVGYVRRIEVTSYLARRRREGDLPCRLRRCPVTAALS